MSIHPLKLILASQSPRRRQLLNDEKYDFVVIPPSDSAENGAGANETPVELVARLAQQKARDVAQRLDRGLVLGCDTVAECCGAILGKPNDKEHAREILQLLQGRVHRVFSGVCLWKRPEDRVLVDVEMTELKMDSLSSQQLDAYLDSDAWRGKAGAFGFQDGLDWVHILKGSPSNVVGLPMELLARMLCELGGT